jgi:glycosyltransferase involved in cell wall biosynthesis
VTLVRVIVPEGIDDPDRPSGGNTYDRRICDGLAELGWSVLEHPVPGSWPWPDASARTALAGMIAAMPDGAVVLLDGLIASTSAAVLVPVAARLRLVVLVHMPLGDGLPDAREAERAVLSLAAAVVTTSEWTRGWLLEHYALRADKVHVAQPGVDAAPLAAGALDGGASDGTQLLCVAAVTPNKGHDLLLDALATTTDLPWRCVCVGTVTRDPEFVDHVRRRAREHGIDDRIRFAGTRVGSELQAAYAAADLVVLASRAETYGMVITEALARGLPVVATAVGGIPEALGHVSDGSRPGLLVPRDDTPAFAAAVRRWLADDALRQQLRQAARERRETLSGWSQTALQISDVLTEVMNRRAVAHVSG